MNRWPVAVCAGAVAACGFQPLALWPLGLIGVAVLVAMVFHARDRRSAAWLGWAWGVGHFTVGNNWIATAFTYQAKMPEWLGGLAVFLLALYLAVFPALAAGGARWLGRERRGALVLAMAAMWIFSEWLRGWAFTGFPWNPLAAIALGAADRPGLAGAILPWMGTYAASGVVVLVAGVLWLAVSATGRKAVAWTMAAGGILLMALASPREPAPLASGVRVTLVQPNIDQRFIDDPAHFEDQFLATAGLSLPRDDRPRLVLWPESGVPDYLRDGYPPGFYGATYLGSPLAARARIGRVIGRESLLLTGTVDLVMRGGEVAGARNVVTVLDGGGDIRGSYAKAHLVPYGEYLPMRQLLAPLGISRLVPGSTDFLPGPGPRTLDLGSLGRVGVQICYEIVFSGAVIDRAHRPDFIFNPSNDGWFGEWGSPQFVAQARLRAVEEGLPVIRATTNGISAIIDAGGFMRAAIPRHVAQRIDTFVPPARGPTLFARWGNLLALAWGLALVVLSQVALRGRSH